MPLTNGFATASDRADHFQKHGLEFRVRNEVEYEGRADRFLGGSRWRWTLECVRSNGDVVRYNLLTREFGVLGRGDVIRTYFRPTRAVHGEWSNWKYFRRECDR